jgi:SAM-dependent methyltransferase
MSDVRAYWEQRLGDDWSLRGVGFARLGRRFNAWQYRLRGEIFAETARGLDLDLGAAQILDVGSGTGFYLEAWRKLGVAQLVGMDLTDAATGSLRRAFPDLQIVRADVTEDELPRPANGFDVISCMDVLFHVVDDDRFEAALHNVHRALAPTGYFVWTDFFVHGPEVRAGHIVYRSLDSIRVALDRTGFDVVSRRPLFVMMNEPRDTRYRVAINAWKGFMWLATRSERVADVIGRLMYRLDRRLVQRRESPSTEIMVCRKRVD